MTHETHFPTASMRLVERILQSGDHAGSLVRVLQQRFVPKDAAAGLEAEWRDVPLVKENT
jgi:hypothetical protein